MIPCVCLLKVPTSVKVGWHMGVGFGDLDAWGQVVVNDVHHKLQTGWQRNTLDEFADGHEVEIEEARYGAFEMDAATRRLEFMYDYRDAYDFFNDNCEHGARGVVTGVAESPQIKWLVIGSLVLVGGLLILKSGRAA